MNLDSIYEHARSIECEILESESKLESAKVYARLAAEGCEAAKNLEIAREYLRKGKTILERVS